MLTYTSIGQIGYVINWIIVRYSNGRYASMITYIFFISPWILKLLLAFYYLVYIPKLTQGCWCRLDDFQRCRHEHDLINDHFYFSWIVWERSHIHRIFFSSFLWRSSYLGMELCLFDGSPLFSNPILKSFQQVTSVEFHGIYKDKEKVTWDFKSLG